MKRNHIHALIVWLAAVVLPVAWWADSMGFRYLPVSSPWVLFSVVGLAFLSTECLLFATLDLSLPSFTLLRGKPVGGD